MDEFERDKLLFATMTLGLPPEWAAATGFGQPDSCRAVLEALEVAPARDAKALLKEMVGELVQSTMGWPADVVRQLDEQLSERGATTLSAARARHSRQLKAIEKRGVIRNEDEAYLVKNVLDGPMDAIPADRFAALQSIFEAYEASIGATP